MLNRMLNSVTLLLCCAAMVTADITLRQIAADDTSSIDWEHEIQLGLLDRPSAETDSLTPLQAASKYNAVKLIQQLVMHGADINAFHPTTKETAVMYAARTGSNDALVLLLSLNANSKSRDSDGRTALHLAALQLFPGGGSKELVRSLYDAGADPNAVDLKGNTPLHMACFFGGDATFVQELLTSNVGAHVNAADHNGNTALHFAASKGKLKEVAILIQHGANITLINAAAETAVSRATAAAAVAGGGKEEEVAQLLRWCGDTTPLITSRRQWKNKNGSNGPPRWNDLTMLEQIQFTQCSKIPIETQMFIDDSGMGNGTFYAYERNHIEALLKSARQLIEVMTYLNVTTTQGVRQAAVLHARKNRQRMPKDNEIWLLEALHASDMENKAVLIIGSQSPWHEALVLAFGASSVSTLEYNLLSYDHPQISTFTPEEFWSSESRSKTRNTMYDVVLSISSFDHDGLGRYGDPIAPDGDLLSMQQLLTASFFTDTTKLILTMPVGEDLLAWNLMRIYGKIRLPMLLRGYHVLERYGYDSNKAEAKFGGNHNFRQSYEPVFVLEKQQLLVKRYKERAIHVEL